MKIRVPHSAFTLTELMLSVGIGVLVLAATFSGAVTLQKTLLAGEEFGADKMEQTRLNDYLALDLRRAETIQGTVGDVLLTLQLPGFYDADGNRITPKVIKSPDAVYVATYDPVPVTVVYKKNGTQITRTEGNGDPVVVATNVADFECTLDLVTSTKFAKTQITFTPSFQRNGAPSSAARTATTVYSTIHLRNKL